jgi:hypothetical protein
VNACEFTFTYCCDLIGAGEAAYFNNEERKTECCEKELQDLEASPIERKI